MGESSRVSRQMINRRVSAIAASTVAVGSNGSWLGFGHDWWARHELRAHLNAAPAPDSWVAPRHSRDEVMRPQRRLHPDRRLHFHVRPPGHYHRPCRRGRPHHLDRPFRAVTVSPKVRQQRRQTLSRVRASSATGTRSESRTASERCAAIVKAAVRAGRATGCRPSGRTRRGRSLPRRSGSTPWL